ncbi:hypothetical protein GCM10007304_41870 [Rhodococcoides trifolii]|uniref:DUF222 domain-containing protein n=1 Tax=Rhodococcoides trifolii TaxID=908250 RepID=A0A917G5B8_9NOCA|nr:HNH endonuclease signature motif containing protein [Rhodococcus trifolii]GGG23627.1 hypothetical protein GCM10007304_41870 [Rhodococcus trifolii]
MVSGGTSGGVGDVVFADLLAAVQKSVQALTDAQSSMLATEDLQQVWAKAVRLGRVLEGASNGWLAQILDTGGFVGVSGSTPHTIGAWLNCSTPAASKRIKSATMLAPRTLPSGEKTEPQFPATAEAAADGAITDEHVTIVSKFFADLSDEVDVETRERAEWQLGMLARVTRPREFGVAATRLAQMIDEDGTPPKDRKDKERKPFVWFGKQGKDGLTPTKGLLDSEMLAMAQALDAKYGKPGAKTGGDVEDDKKSGSSDDDELDLDLDATDTDSDVDANDEPPARTDPPRWDLRSAGERRHDALKVIMRSYLASGRAGKHRGVTCAPIVTMTIDQLEKASGMALTATGSSIPVRDALRMASGQHAFLLLLDEHERPLYLGRTKRLGTEDQRLVLYATERGCSFPGCSKSGVWCQVHHTDEWVVDDGMTDIDSLTLACEEHHRIVGPGDNDWATTIAGPDHRYPGRTLWHPPKAWDPTRTGRVNHFHHPEELLIPPDEQH